jgi:AAA family ATP:ADP antiporter
MAERQESTTAAGRLTPLNRLINLQAGELVPVFWSFAYFYFLLSSYYVIRPVRDEMGIIGGIDNLQWLFTATFVVMLAIVPLFGAASNHYPRQRLLPGVYLFFIANLVIFYFVFRMQAGTDWTARIFFIWVSVFNLFVVSVFWSFMADLFSNAQGKRLFGLIAAWCRCSGVLWPTCSAMPKASVCSA